MSRDSPIADIAVNGGMDASLNQRDLRRRRTHAGQRGLLFRVVLMPQAVRPVPNRSRVEERRSA
jgi:hypothetical protein